MTGTISRSVWINLYKQLQREADKLAQYNHRSFAHRRIRDYFEANKGVTDVAQQQKLLKEGQDALAVIKRQTVLGQLYPHRKTFVEEEVDAAKPKPKRH